MTFIEGDAARPRWRPPRLRTGRLSLALPRPACRARRVARRGHGRGQLGVRSGGCRARRATASAPTVKVVEPTGHESIVLFDADGHDGHRPRRPRRPSRAGPARWPQLERRQAAFLRRRRRTPAECRPSVDRRRTRSRCIVSAPKQETHMDRNSVTGAGPFRRSTTPFDDRRRDRREGCSPANIDRLMCRRRHRHRRSAAAPASSGRSADGRAHSAIRARRRGGRRARHAHRRHRRRHASRDAIDAHHVPPTRRAATAC